MNFIVSMILLLVWMFSGYEVTEALAGAVAFGAFYIPEYYITKKFKK